MWAPCRTCCSAFRVRHVASRFVGCSSCVGASPAPSRGHACRASWQLHRSGRARAAPPNWHREWVVSQCLANRTPRSPPHIPCSDVPVIVHADGAPFLTGQLTYLPPDSVLRRGLLALRIVPGQFVTVRPRGWLAGWLTCSPTCGRMLLLIKLMQWPAVGCAGCVGACTAQAVQHRPSRMVQGV